MSRCLGEDQEEICSSTEGEDLCLEDQSLDQLSALLVKDLGTPRPSFLQIMEMVFKGLVVHAGSGDISPNIVTHSMHTYPQMSLNRRLMDNRIIRTVTTTTPILMIPALTIQKSISKSRKVYMSMKLLRVTVLQGFLI